MNKKTNSKLQKILKVALPVFMYAVLVTGIVWGRYESANMIEIIPELIPSASATEYEVKQMNVDINVIPDKYNTGCKGELTKITEACVVNGIQLMNSKGTIVLDFYHANKTFSGHVEINNCDFSGAIFSFNSEGSVSGKKISITFNNCKFGTVKTSMPKSDVFTYTYNNCTIAHFIGSNSTFNNCQFGHSYYDGVLPFQNVEVNDSYFCDFASTDPAGAGVHSDGSQIYANASVPAENITFNNCRFEIPAVQPSGNAAKVNACISVALEYNDANHIHINNCIVNGGGYTLYATKKYEYLTLQDIKFRNVKVGGARLFGNIYPKIADGVSFENVDNQDTLYVSSVWYDAGKIHTIVSNDTSIERKFKVVTSAGTEEFTIPACLGGNDLRYNNFDIPFSAFPFDIDISVNAPKDYVICYDVTNGIERQIRFVSFTNEPVFYGAISDSKLNSNNGQLAVSGETSVSNSARRDFSSEGLLSKKEEAIVSSSSIATTVISEGIVSTLSTSVRDDVNVISEGSCGNDLFYTVSSDGVLHIYGSGLMTNYNSVKCAPWFAYADEINLIVIDEGITRIGTQAFRMLTKVETVDIPESVSLIGSNSFIGCKALKWISLYSNVTEIGQYAFRGTNLGSVLFYGDKKSFESIQIGPHNEPFVESNITYQIERLNGEVIMSGSCGKEAYYELSADGIMHIFGTGDMDNYHSKKLAPWAELLPEITQVVVDEGITSIGNQSFRLATSLSKVILPNSLLSIGSNAFSACKALKSINLGVNITSIGQSAFSSTGLETASYEGTRIKWKCVIVGPYNEKLVECISTK